MICASVDGDDVADLEVVIADGAVKDSVYGSDDFIL